jgi:hypothetical protein
MQTIALVEKVLAGAVVLVCVALLVRQFIGAPRRYRLDASLRRVVRWIRTVAWRLFRWPATQRAARREAEAAIRRARDAAGEWDGNVYRPKPQPRKPRKLH